MKLARPLQIALVSSMALGCGAALRSGVNEAPTAARSHNRLARDFLCGDIGESTCLAACADHLPSRDHVECLIDLRFRSDPEALELARRLYVESGAVPGLDMRGAIEGFRGEEVVLYPALPVGERRHHLAWLHASLESFAGFVDAIGARAAKKVSFEARPKGFVFFRTSVPSYPSAYTVGGVIGYNLDGPLHSDQREMHETLFHELFHLNDQGHDGWSGRVLTPVFDGILSRCGADHECLTPFAPHVTVVPDGTFYAFDERTRDVREYAAELALRYFLEHEAVLGGASTLAPFKCQTEDNRFAWTALVEEFFGGADLTPACEDEASRDAAASGQPGSPT